MENTFLKIHKSALKFLAPLTPQDTYKLVAEEARKLVRAEYGSILLEEHGELVKVYAYPDVLYQVKNRKQGFMQEVFHSRKPIILDIADFGDAHPIYKNMKVKTSIGVPLSLHGKPVGVLTLHSLQKKAFKSEDIMVLKLFASLAALAIKKTQLYDEAEKALQARDHFISMAAHELKTPITTINGYVQLLYNNLETFAAQKQLWVKELSWETYRLIQLVNELLAVDGIKAGKLKYSWRQNSLKDIIHRAVNSFKFSYPNHQIVVKNHLGTKSDLVIADFDKLLQVLTNLLDNAAKFSAPGSKVTISLSIKSPDIVLTIKDQGHGIPKNDLLQIFDRFYKGRNHKREGMGLGLYLVKEIIAEHKGRIKISSKQDKGTIVTINLPEVKYD